MTRTAITPSQLLGTLSNQYTAGAATFTLAAGDAVNGNSFPVSGRDLIVAYNSGASPYTITITSAPDYDGRTLDIAAYSIPGSGHALFGPFLLDGWRQSDGNIYFMVSNASVLVGAFRVPGV